MEYFKEFIKSTIHEYLNERYQINNLPKDVVLMSKGLTKNYGKFLLFDINNKQPIGYIELGLHNPINSFNVHGAYSQRGYGPFLYECAMTYVYPKGLSMSRNSTTSDDALRVWFKFKERTDVKKERINSDEITHKKDDWINGGFLDDNPEYRQSIFDLEDTRFFYTFGKTKLNNLLQIGKEYMNENNISEQDVEYMSWDLEE